MGISALKYVRDEFSSPGAAAFEMLADKHILHKVKVKSMTVYALKPRGHLREPVEDMILSSALSVRDKRSLHHQG